jgi:hypothetical protein
MEENVKCKSIVRVNHYLLCAYIISSHHEDYMVNFPVAEIIYIGMEKKSDLEIFQLLERAGWD